jgi:hypothetical protein
MPAAPMAPMPQQFDFFGLFIGFFAIIDVFTDFIPFVGENTFFDSIIDSFLFLDPYKF